MAGDATYISSKSFFKVSIMFVNFINVNACRSSLFFYHCIVYYFLSLIAAQFSHPSFFRGGLVDFQFFAFTYHSAMNILAHAILCIDVKISLEYIFRSGLWGHQLYTSYTLTDITKLLSKVIILNLYPER